MDEYKSSLDFENTEFYKIFSYHLRHPLSFLDLKSTSLPLVRFGDQVILVNNAKMVKEVLRRPDVFVMPKPLVSSEVIESKFYNKFCSTLPFMSTKPHQSLRKKINPAFCFRNVDEFQNVVAEACESIFSHKPGSATGSRKVPLIDLANVDLPLQVTGRWIGLTGSNLTSFIDNGRSLIRGLNAMLLSKCLSQYDPSVDFVDQNLVSQLESISSCPASSALADLPGLTVSRLIFLLSMSGVNSVYSGLSLVYKIFADRFGDLKDLVSMETSQLQRFIRKVLFLYPPISFISRSTNREVDVGGFLLPTNSTVVCNLQSAHVGVFSAAIRVPASSLTGKHINRFLEGNESSPPSLSFGTGPHRCLGEPLALEQVQKFIRYANESGLGVNVPDTCIGDSTLPGVFRSIKGIYLTGKESR